MKPSSELGTSNQQPATSTFLPKKLPWLEAHVVALARYRPGPKGVQRDEGRVNGCSSTMDYLIPPKILRPFGKNSKHNGFLNACPGASIFEAVNWWVVHSRGPQNDDPPICPWRKANFFADHQPHQPPCGQPRKNGFISLDRKLGHLVISWLINATAASVHQPGYFPGEVSPWDTRWFQH